jgi:hypothetical protein
MMRYGQRKQIQVGDLTMSKYPAPIDQAIGAKTDIVWPQLVINIATGQRHLGAHGFKSSGSAMTVGRQVQHAQDAVFHQRAGCDLQLGFLKERKRSIVVYVRIVQQCNPDVDTQKQPRLCARTQMPSCSIRRRTCSVVIISSREGRTEYLLRNAVDAIGTCALARKASRTYRDTASPREVRSRCARWRATANTSSSSDRVVRIRPP